MRMIFRALGLPCTSRIPMNQVSLRRNFGSAACERRFVVRLDSTLCHILRFAATSSDHFD